MDLRKLSKRQSKTAFYPVGCGSLLARMGISFRFVRLIYRIILSWFKGPPVREPYQSLVFAFGNMLTGRNITETRLDLTSTIIGM